jgi:hypothetical protein
MTICDKAMQSFRYPGMDDWTNVDKPFLLSELLKDDKVTAGFTFDEQAGFASLLLHEVCRTVPEVVTLTDRGTLVVVALPAASDGRLVHRR